MLEKHVIWVRYEFDSEEEALEFADWQRDFNDRATKYQKEKAK